jgi:hypothetical protein
MQYPLTLSKHCALLWCFVDSLRAGRPGDQILVGARFFALVQTDLVAHPAFCTIGTSCVFRV